MKWFFVLVFAIAVAGCQKPAAKQGTTLQAEPPQQKSAPPPARAILTITDVEAPESVLYDADQDVYFISNINGGELALDNNGFISRVDAATLAVDLHWIQGGAKGVTLHCPKGMGIVGDTLYVSDGDGVRKFNRRTGAPQGIVPLPGAVFINDITTNGRDVYVSDTGLGMGAGTTFKDAQTDAVWRIHEDRATKIAAGKELAHPNGLEFADGKLWVVTFGSNELYQLADGKKTNVTMLPKGHLDGVVRLPDGRFLVSSWQGNCVYRGPAGGPFEAVVQSISMPADIGYDSKRHRLLIPHSGASEVTIHALP